MLPKSKRLNLKKDFKWVAQGKRLETVNFKLFFRYGENTQPKVAVATSSQLFKKATQRNKAKRTAFKALQEVYPALQRGTNLVIMPKSAVLEKSVKELTEELKNVQSLNFSD